MERDEKGQFMKGQMREPRPEVVQAQQRTMSGMPPLGATGPTGAEMNRGDLWDQSPQMVHKT
jgi:hypothetical protein